MNANAPAGLQIRMRLGAQTLLEKAANFGELFLGYRGGPARKAHQARHSWDLEHAKTILQCQVNENISRKQRHPETNFAVLPFAKRFVLREEAFHAAFGKLPGDAQLVVGAGVSRVPLRLDAGLRFGVKSIVLRFVCR